MLNRLKALLLLSECTGDEIWSVEHCRLRGVPEVWIDELSDGFESGFKHNSQTIYVDEAVVNQYEGVRDVDLAQRLGAYLGVEIEPLQEICFSRAALVRAIQQAVEDD
ncbi:MAG: hypothetical protein R3C53_14055 [Pirellulaceae bacterium]